MRCDSHIHIVGSPEAYPLAPTRTYTPGIATLGQIERVAAPMGVTRFVVVQPSFYRTDNTLLLEGLAALGDRGRGVAVIDPAAVGRMALLGMHAHGVRGARLNLYSTLSGQAARALQIEFAALAQAAHSVDWHVEVIAPIAMLAEAAALLAASSVPVVIDHYGLHSGAAPDSVHGRSLLELLRNPHVWIKLSAPYRVSPDPLALQADPAWTKAILEVAAERCVWGSDWPHTPPHDLQTGNAVPLAYRDLAYATVVDGFRASLGSDELADRVMALNPAQLYAF